MSNQLILKAKKYGIFGLPLVSLGLLIYLLHTTSPLTIGPAGILLVFVLLYIGIVCVLYLVSFLVIKVLASLTPLKQPTKQKLYYTASIIGFGPIFLLALHSIGQLEIKDFLLVSLFISVSCFYVNRRMQR
jgi:hypothetical protein